MSGRRLFTVVSYRRRCAGPLPHSPNSRPSLVEPRGRLVAHMPPPPRCARSCPPMSRRGVSVWLPGSLAVVMVLLLLVLLVVLAVCAHVTHLPDQTSAPAAGCVRPPRNCVTTLQQHSSFILQVIFFCFFPSFCVTVGVAHFEPCNNNTRCGRTSTRISSPDNDPLFIRKPNSG